MAYAELKELTTVQEAESKIKEHSLVVILFNERYPGANTMEHTFNWCRTIYENRYNIFCYKCVISIDEHEFKSAFNIEGLPTFLFFRDGKEITRFENANQPDPNAASIPKEEKDPKEYRLRTYLNKLLTKPN